MWHKAQVVLLNLIFWPLALLVTGVFAIASAIYITAYALITGNERQAMRLLRRTITHYGRAVILCAWPFVRVRYVDLAPEERPPFIYISNHRSSSDGFMMAVLPIEGVQVVNIWPFKIPLLGWVAKLAGYLSVREMPIEEFVSRGTKLLKEGVSICAFPEGTRSGSRMMGQFHSSAFKLSLESGARVAPLAISGNERIPPRGSMVLRPGRITIHKLPAFDPAQESGVSTFAAKAKVRQRLQEHLGELEASAT